MAQAKALYLKATGEGGEGASNEAKRAEGAIAKAEGDTSSKAGEGRTPGMGTAVNKATQGDWGGFIMDLVKGAVNAVSPGQPFGAEEGGDMGNTDPSVYNEPNFQATKDGAKPSGSRANAQPREARASSPQSTKGTVSGEVKITVDQAGRVTAPPTVKLSGNQTAVNSRLRRRHAEQPVAGRPILRPRQSGLMSHDPSTTVAACSPSGSRASSIPRSRSPRPAAPSKTSRVLLPSGHQATGCRSARHLQPHPRRQDIPVPHQPQPVHLDLQPEQAGRPHLRRSCRPAAGHQHRRLHRAGRLRWRALGVLPMR